MNLSPVDLSRFALGEINANDAGQATGQALVWIALLAGALKCWSISSRPTTNRKCALSLMFILLGFLAVVSVGYFARSAGMTASGIAVRGLLSLIALALIVTALVMAILGLSEYSHKRDVYVQGRAQAIWSLVLAGFMVLTAGAGFIVGLMRASRAATFPSQSRPGQMLTFNELNFRFRAPDRPWVSYDASKINRNVKLSFMRRFPEAYVLVTAEQPGMEENLSTEQIAVIGKANLQAAAQSARILSETPLKIKGMSGLLVETEASLRTHSVYYLHWYLATNGYAYQLVGYGRSEDRQRISSELREMFSRFELVDTGRLAPSVRSGFPTNFVSAQHLYSVTLTNSAWHPYATLQKNVPDAEFGASRADSCFVVVPVWLAGENLDSDSLASALLATFNINYPNENLSNRKALDYWKLKGLQYDFVRDIDGKAFRYRFQILQGNDQAYLVAAWTQRQAAEAEGILNDALARVEFTAAPAILPSTPRDLSPRERRIQGFVLNQAGLSHFKSGEHEKALPLFCAAARADSAASTHILNALRTWQRLERPKQALEYLSAQPAAVLAFPETRAWQAFFQGETALTDLAITNYAKLFAEGFRNDDHFCEYVNLLKLQRQYDQALVEAEKYLKQSDSVTVRLLEAGIWRLKIDLPKAIKLLKAQREKAPFNSQVMAALADTYLQAGLCTEALEICREMLKGNPDSAYAHQLRGRSELGLKWYREAKVSFETAAKLAPANKETAAYLEHISGLLGEANNHNLMEPIEMVVVPAALTNAATDPVPAGYATNYGAYFVRRLVAVSWVSGKEYKRTDMILVRVLDAAGVAAFSTVQFPFDPLGEQIFVNEVRVLDSAGKTLSLGNVADYYVLDDNAGKVASQKKVLNIPVRGLQPDTQLAVTVSRREFGRAEEFPFLEHTFAGGVPVRESLVFFRGDFRLLKHRTTPSIEPQTSAECWFWRLANPMIERWEPLQSPRATFLPMLWMADATAQWPVLASNYLASISNRLVPDAAVAKQARETVLGLKDAEAKVAALSRFVQTNCTYKAIEFGRRARIPNQPADILRNRYGDCKDHALLLQQMLQAVDVPSHLALISHRGPVQQDLASLDQFDHMVVYVPTGRASSFVDCTDKGADTSHAIPFGLAGREALILDPRNPRFIPIPDYAANASTVEVRRKVSLKDLADVAVAETLTLTGPHAAFMRDYLLKIPQTSRRIAFQRGMGLADSELSEFAAEPLDVPTVPLQLRCAYILKKQFHGSNDRLAGVLRAGVERSYLAAEPVDDRVSPFEVSIPLLCHTIVTIDIPEGFRAEPPGDLAPKLDSRFADCQGRLRLDGSGLQLEFQCRQPIGKFNASDYAAYRDTMSQTLSVLEREVVFKRGPL